MFENLTEKLTGVFTRLRRKGRITEADFNDVMREVRISLLEADVNQKVVKDFLSRVKERAVGEKVWESLSPDEMIIKFCRDELVELLGEEDVRFQWSPQPPTVVLLCGLQGSGKTTTAAKLAVWLKKQGKKPMLAAADLQRPAAITQLEVLGEQADVPVFSQHDAKDAVKVTREAIEKAKHLLCDVLIVDTAGRLQVDEALMEELRRVRDVAQPSETLLVLDSTTGQQALDVAQAFHEAVHLTGLVFTKLDGDARGGAVLSVRAVTGCPVRFVGVGEGLDALEPFHGKRIAERILGFGDVLSLVEKVQEKIDLEEAMEMQESLKSGSMDFNTLLSQIRTMKKMGSIANLVKLIPGAGLIPREMLDKLDQGVLNKTEALILSMTPIERANPDILNGSRKRRIAVGAGSTVEELNRLIKGLHEMRKQMRQFLKSGDRRKKKTKAKRKRR
ncbi:MAG: signal recognition particle protein [Fimbriimonadales bacterium]|nr:MAG: signal recognition particle protein [Fimbriimonadales bacterium]